jgi:double-stranded uracil-DNA glycosylase
MAVTRPTPQELRAAAGKTIPDVITPGLKVLFCGINPGLLSAAVGHHFARPGNRFWPALYQSGITPRLLAPEEDRSLLEWGYGITNVVARSSAAADELTAEEFIAGGKILEEKILRNFPHILAVLGVGAYRTAFARPLAMVGKQTEQIGDTILWVLPNPSGLNAHYRLEDFVTIFHKLKIEAE